MDQPAKRREIAFQILLLLLDNYPRGITNDNLDTQRLDSILQLFEQMLSSVASANQLSRDDLNLFRIGSSIISRIGKMSSTFTIYFDRCFNISRRFFEIGRSRGFKVLISESSETITQLSIGLPKSLIDKLPALYEEIFTEFENLSNDHIEKDLFFFLQAEYCTMITGFLLQFAQEHQEYLEQIARHTLDKVINLFDTKDSRLYKRVCICQFGLC